MYFIYFSQVWVAEWPPIVKMAAQSAYHNIMFSQYRYLSVNLVFPSRFFEFEFIYDCAIS